MDEWQISTLASFRNNGLINVMTQSLSEAPDPKESLHGRVLVWTYKRGAQGFTWTELKEGLGLKDEQLKWVQEVLYYRALDVEKWFDRMGRDGDGITRDKNQKYYIAPHGTSAAVDYINLRELERSSARAQRTAIASIIIGALVGIGQIVAAFLKH